MVTQIQDASTHRHGPPDAHRGIFDEESIEMKVLLDQDLEIQRNGNGKINHDHHQYWHYANLI
jgi:hypothetical protein